jgi:carboxylesterase type B
MQSIPTDDPVFLAMFPAEYEPPKDPMSEDCLKLAIWKPAGKLLKSLPVVIFIHGGAFSGGSETVPYQIPTQWVQRLQNLIVVSLK